MSIAATEYIAPNYLARFQCIGAACEESCCTGWQVAFDADHYQKLKRRMGGSPEERAEFEDKVHPVAEAQRRPGQYALVVLDDRRDCTFFDCDRLCSLQKRYGSEVLSDTCANYPRNVALVGTRVELTAKVSCPEIARKLLLAPDAMALSPVPASILERGAVNRSLNTDATELYDRALDVVRATALDLLGDARYPFGSRLAFVGCLADELGPVLYRGAPDSGERRMLEVMGRARSNEMKNFIHREFSAVEVPDGFAKSIVLRVLSSRMGAGTGTFGRLVHSIFGDAGVAFVALVDEELAGRAVDAYQQGKRRCAPFAPRVDTYFANYAMNYFLQDWYTSAPNVAAHMQNLLLRVAIIRFLLLCHPTLAGESLDEKTLDRVAVEVFYKFSRGVEHNEQFLAAIEKDFGERAAGIAHAMFLAKF
jgi:lysine-N-methylase